MHFQRAFARFHDMTGTAWNSDAPLDLKLSKLWDAFTHEGLAFWLMCAYLMFEYVRPQSIYPALQVVPWTSATMAATVGAALVSRQTRFISSPANVLLLAFSCVVVLSSIAAYRPDVSFARLDVYFLWLLAYAAIVLVVTNERRMLLMILAFVLFNLKMSLFATRQWISMGFAFHSWGIGGAPGWFQNGGEFGIEMCVFFPIVMSLAVGLRPRLSRWKYFVLVGIGGTSLVGMVASASRGALLGGAAVIMFLLARSSYKLRALAVTIVVGTVLFLAIPSQQKSRLAEAGDDATSQSRLTYWKHGIEMTNEHPLLGIGFENWGPYYRDHIGYTSSRQEVAHNTVVEAASELGYSGLLVFVLLIGCTFVLNARTRAMAIRVGQEGRLTFHLATGLDGALIGFLVSGFFISALYYPFFWINLAMTVSLNTVAKSLPQPGLPRPAWQVGNRQVFGAPPAGTPPRTGVSALLPRR